MMGPLRQRIPATPNQQLLLDGSFHLKRERRLDRAGVLLDEALIYAVKSPSKKRVLQGQKDAFL